MPSFCYYYPEFIFVTTSWNRNYHFVKFTHEVQKKNFGVNSLKTGGMLLYANAGKDKSVERKILKILEKLPIKGISWESRKG